MNRLSLFAAAVAVSAGLGASAARADEGMWTFDNFPAAQVKAKYGVDIDKIEKKVRAKTSKVKSSAKKAASKAKKSSTKSPSVEKSAVGGTKKAKKKSTKKA